MALGADAVKSIVDEAMARGSAWPHIVASFFVSPDAAASALAVVGGQGVNQVFTGPQVAAIVHVVSLARGWRADTSDNQKIADIGAAYASMTAFVKAFNAAQIIGTSPTVPHRIGEGGMLISALAAL